ncbi:MAG: Bax inhibitor-1/YccA family protein, partial [Alphaproteobacteria bacterium]|nr:Bax inhibitor-1/YccA family protein [Alphaproteobacteria bacterium]
LRAYMLRVYNYMAVGLALTGLAAYFTFNMAVQNGALTAFGTAIFVGPLKWVVILAPLALVFFMSFRLHTLSVATAQAVFWIYAALVGVSFGSLGLIYTSGSIARVFLITAVAFGSLSLWGYTTKRDLSGWGSFLFMGLMGIIVASLVNIFFASSAMNFALSVISVLVFTGFTAYDTQAIKETYYEADSATTMGHKAIMGALRLYLDFINLFLSLLRLFGDRR